MDELTIPAEVSKITALLGDRVRITILWTLLDGRAYTAIELASRADTSSQNISIHISKLVQAGLLAVEKQGRHKYYRLSGSEVATAVESLGSLIPPVPHKKITLAPEISAVKQCRTCYDHLAGNLGVLINDYLLQEQILRPVDREYRVTPRGTEFFQDIGLDVIFAQQNRRTFARPCLDWTERKHHLAGALGAAMLSTMLAKNWVRKIENTRALMITASGESKIYDTFKISIKGNT